MNDRPFWIYGKGTQRRAFTYIEDFTPYVVRAGLSKRCSGQIFNIGPEEEISLNRLADLVLREFCGGEGEIPRYLRPRHWRAGRPLEVADAFSSQRKAQRMLGYRTTVPIREGVRRMVAWALTLGPQPFVHLKHGLELRAGAPPTWTRKLY
jgi:UDP-glucose 4-epimerase